MDLQIIKQRIKDLTPAEGYGIQRYNNSKAKEYRYYWVNKDQSIGLLSKAYKSATSRNKAITMVADGKYHLIPIEGADQFYYKLINQNKLIMAMGPIFASAETRDKAMEQLRSLLAPKSNNEVVTKNQESQDRHSFRIQLYRGSSEEAWQGRITHPLSEKRQSFHGINLEEMGSFMKKIIKEEPKPTNSDVIPTLPEVPTLSLMHDGKQLQASSVNIGTALDVYFDLKQFPDLPDNQLQIIAKSLDSGQQTVIGASQDVVVDDTALSLSIQTTDLDAGFYRFSANLISNKPKSSTTTTASSILYLVN